MFLQIHHNKWAQQRKFRHIFSRNSCPRKYMPKNYAVGLFCWDDKFEEILNEKVINLSKLTKPYFSIHCFWSQILIYRLKYYTTWTFLSDKTGRPTKSLLFFVVSFKGGKKLCLVSYFFTLYCKLGWPKWQRIVYKLPTTVETDAKKGYWPNLEIVSQ